MGIKRNCFSWQRFQSRYICHVLLCKKTNQTRSCSSHAVSLVHKCVAPWKLHAINKTMNTSVSFVWISHYIQLPLEMQCNSLTRNIICGTKIYMDKKWCEKNYWTRGLLIFFWKDMKPDWVFSPYLFVDLYVYSLKRVALFHASIIYV